MRKHLLVASATVALAASMALAHPAASAAPRAWDLVVLQDAPLIVDSVVIDGELQERTFEAVLRDKDGRKIGMLYGSHRDFDAKDRPGLDVRYRTLVFEFADGQIVAQGVSKYKTKGPFLSPGKRTTIAITGGTGAYSGVKGEVKTVHLGKGEHRQMLDFVD
jgi:hypothetical protein